MDSFDIILGKPWLAQHNPTIDWRTNTIHSPFFLKADAQSEDPSPRIQLISADKMTKLLTKHAASTPPQVWLATVTENLSTSTPPPTDTPPPPPPPPLQPATDLSPSSQTSYHAFLQRYSQWFSEPSGTAPPLGIYHSIPTQPDAKIPQHRVRRMSTAEIQEVQKQLKWYLEKGWIRPSTSPYGAPVVFAKKADGTLCFAIDYRALNNITIKNRTMLPRIDEALDHLRGAKYFTSLIYSVPTWTTS